MSTVVFQRHSDTYTVRFSYHPALVELLKTAVPSYARSWTKATKSWTVDAGYAVELASALRCEGHKVVGLESPRAAKASTADPDGWATELLRRVGPTRREPVFRALTWVLHPDNQQTGDTRLLRELNQARADLE